MASERNALAELAGRLNPDRATIDDLDMAKRIVAELAKVKNHECSMEPIFLDCKNAVRNCRAIAEEGTGGGIKSS